MLPRERYLLAGPDGSGPADLVALVLGTGAGGRTARGIASDLLDRFGGLRGIAAASPAALAGVRGVGPARAIRLHAGLVLGQRAATEARVNTVPVTTPAGAAEWFLPALDGLDHEEFHALYLDKRLRPLGYRRLSSGNDAYTVVDPRQVFRPGIEVGAGGVIVGHNHPSGDPEPSDADRQATRVLARAGQLIGIEVRDHLVVGGGNWVSLATRGELQ